MEQYDIVIIGAGPAGLFCAIHAACPGRRILLLEKNKKSGVKLLLSGSGQCNITHGGDIRNFLSHYGGHGKQVAPALLNFSNQDLIDFFQRRGLVMEMDENGKVFPRTRCSADVLAILVNECRERGIELRCEEPVTGVLYTPGGFEVATSAVKYLTTTLVITTGGASYPKTGSTGDGYRFSESLGQQVTEIAPALAPLRIRNYPFGTLSGMSFEQMPFSVWRAGKKISNHTGDVLFTHLGLSGPGILDASRNIRKDDEIRLSFIGNIKPDEFAADLIQRSGENQTLRLNTLLAMYPIPERLIRLLLELSKIPQNLTSAHLSVSQRKKLVIHCAQFPLVVAAAGDFGSAMVTRGGIALEGMNLKTMESRIVPNLYFAGEVLDIDGDTGGYNLQAAFSTGYVAAQSIRKKWNV